MSARAHAVIEQAAATGRIRLTDLEHRVFALLIDVVQRFHLKDTLRVAGGWVRDKLLGRESLDIDITTDSLSGSDLALHIEQLLKEKNEKDAARFKILPVPEQSAHLQVSTIKLYDLEIDLNALRTEVYDPESRIPKVSPGTILEDTARRDFTINALYYNINQDAIEDFTDTGLSDLDLGLVRTPADPLRSFKEDPLRVLRAIRYTGRYGFKLEDAARHAILDPQVKECLQTKVSRERYGIEVDKMFKADHPLACLSLLCNLGLYDVVFHSPAEYHRDPTMQMVPFPYFPVPLRMIEPRLVMEASLEIANRANKSIVAKAQDGDHHAVQTVLLSAFFSPLWGYICSQDKKVTHRSIVYHMLRRGICLSKASAEMICHMLFSAQQFAEVSRQVLKLYVEKHEEATAPLPDDQQQTQQQQQQQTQQQQQQQGDVDLGDLPADVRLAIGKAMVTAGEHWRDAIILCDVFARHFHAFVIERYLPSALLMPWIEKSGLVGCWTWRPLLSGRDVMTILDIKGPMVGRLVQRISDEMLLQPRMTREECEQWLRDNVQALMAECDVDKK
ncbi:hypothetical protein PTSG_07347 [Salpingoeca rosetta]|uniref:Poly A polymerase head domain-containing protein n=1 Tax=Salpingoeca rosetta (strain ATCC 50818 / BSB-021) TaxID=946362 RepID=F2UJ56_SALR5|nr:uncharacterized protein PTSG_07347 [Salpingoeca rosetta]EGD77004.1 hypothetical protein PTSG_07347 [Salpingoeca rosetta]|eukprot:XP_004990844.1 hypothetical protein PTSG_07347 [Salpingoeca rosetta]